MHVRAGIVLFVFAVVSSFLPSSGLAVPVHVWSGSFGDNQGRQIGQSVAIDPAGNVVVVGGFGGSLDFGGGPMGPAGAKDGAAYVAKFDPAGNFLWSHWYAAASTNQYAQAVTFDSGGNVLISVEHTGTVDFGGGPIAAVGFDIVILKLDASGNHVWSRGFGAAGSYVANDIAVDSFDNVLMTGSFNGTLDFGCGPMASSLGSNLFVAKLDPAGNCLWSKRAGSGVYQAGNSIAIDSADNVFVGGDVNGTIDFGGGPLTSAGSIDMVLAKLDPNGAHLWSKLFGSAAGTESCTSIACDAAGHVSLAGVVNCVPPGKNDPPCVPTIDFGGGPLTGAGGYDVVLADFDASGAHQWSKLFGDAVNQIEASVAIDSDGDRLYFGTFNGTVDFGTGPLAAFGSNLFLVRFDSAGSAQWANEYGLAGSIQSGHSVAANNGGFAITGTSGPGQANYGGGPISSFVDGDVFVAKFSEAEAVPVLISSFTATARDGGIDVRWNMSNDEELSSFALYRGEKDSPQPRQIAGGAFVDANSLYFDSRVAPGTTYNYQLVVRTVSGDEFHSPVATATAPGLGASLGQNHPNPFNPATTVEYSVAEQSPVVIGIYDATGALVTRLDQGVRSAGTYSAQWNGRDAAGKPVGSGVYFYRLEGSRATASRKMVLLK